ncbi:NAD-dependent epimerase/dehydratase family protein [Streptomyces sp. NPDC005808]|uniref:NAD-dependent epimerase/dehydratase family protein n=1 Tax=Streptomyces sp. NPDC005808 TaxID=3364734 RepID=UPI0036B5F683
MATVFVTGGSGFVGSRLITRLIKEGHSVRALARSDAAAGKVKDLGALPVRGDLADVAGLRAAVAGSELAFHSAARTAGPGTREQFWADNVDGTANLVRAARAAGVRRLVHVSTEAVVMNGRPLVNVDESAPLRPDSRAPYVASKAAAEQIVIDANGSLETVVVRPRFIWGAGDTSLLPVLVDMVNSGRFAWVGGGRHLTDTAHVDNVVEGLMLAAERGRPGQTYFVTDGEPVAFRDILTELLATQGVSAPTKSLPYGVARTVAAVGETLWRGLRLKGAPPLDYLSMWVTSLECTIDITKARTELGYQPIKTQKEGLAELR